jgi:hypothetical protein
VLPGAALQGFHEVREVRIHPPGQLDRQVLERPVGDLKGDDEAAKGEVIRAQEVQRPTGNTAPIARHVITTRPASTTGVAL